MKLIIDIPEEDYKGICHLKNEQLRMLPVEVAETLIRIANGIPLDDIKAEIEKKCEAFEKCNAYECANGLNWALKVIDKHMAERSE